MKKAYQKPEIKVVSVDQEMYLMRGSTFENYAKQNDFVEDESYEKAEGSNDGLHYTLPNIGNMWTDEDE